MLKFFRRSKNKSKTNDASQTSKNAKNSKLQIPTAVEDTTINQYACAKTNGNDINKTQENLKFVADHIDHSGKVLVQNDRSTNDRDQILPSKRHEFKKEISSRNEIVDQKQCQTEDVSRRSITIDRKSIKQDQQLPSDHDQSSHKTTTFNPINKSREFFNGIMARGRNRHRNRNKQQKENKSNIKDCQQPESRAQGFDYPPAKCDLNSACDKGDNPPVADDFQSRENFHFGYQITKSKNSTNLIMRLEEDGGELDEHDDGRDENDQNNTTSSSSSSNSTSSNNNESTETDVGSGNTGNSDHEVLCAGATDEISHQNSIDVGQLNEHCDNNDHTESIVDDSEELRQDTTEYYSDDQNVESADYDDDDHGYNVDDLPHTVVEIGEQDKTEHPQEFTDDQLKDAVAQISELTECDRDNYINIKMGQPVSKTPQQQQQKSSIISQDQQNITNSEKNRIILPTITVADYSDLEKGINNETEIFYDSEQSFDTETDLADKPIEIVDLDDEIDNTNNNNNNYSNTNYNDGDIHQNGDDENEWHFVTHDSDHVTFENDPDPNDDRITSGGNIVNSRSENFSTTSFTDSGLGSSGNIVLIDSSTIVNDSENNNQLNCDSDFFLRGSSTDCDENLLQSDYEIIYDNEDVNEKGTQHILIDSISLPDVVVESTGMGTALSTPIKVETIENTVARENTANVEIPNILNNDHKEEDKRDLVNQEARFSAQVEEAQKEALSAQERVNDLQLKIDELEKELSEKSWNVDRLQAELESAQKEDLCVRQRLKNIENEKESLKQQICDTEAELNSKYEKLESEYEDLQEKYDQLKILSKNLQTQLAFAKSNAEQLKLEKQRLKEEKDEELRNLREALEKLHEEKKESEQKWQKEFENLRTQNAEKEEHLLIDCEWQMRNMQKTCKDKIEVAEKAKSDALERACSVEKQLEEQAETFRHLKCCEAELRQLRGLTCDQRQSLILMTEQMEDLRADLDSANQELEDQIAEVKKIKKTCEITLSIKDREMIQKIDEGRGEVALQWETRLLTEMTRLKAELEVVHGEDRLDALQKLQDEHIEELKALTTRYTANEEELQAELKTLRQKYQEKEAEFKQVRLKAEESLMETRLHLDRADRDYQRAMNREEEKREALCEQMKKEFAEEKLDMEEKFRERLSQVKEEFSKELAHNTEELTIRHRKQLELQWEQLIAEKEEALQAMESRHRIRLEEAENKIKDIEIEHQRDMKELKNNFDIERTTLESRDLQNSQEIDQLHRKCRCLTNLFEEMRMRYERRDPRPEDLNEIAELRSRCESQERDLQLLTERLRDVQMNMQNQQSEPPQPHPKRKAVRKPPPKTIPTSCDVIYEENEERDSPPKENGMNGTETTTTNELIEENEPIES